MAAAQYCNAFSCRTPYATSIVSGRNKKVAIRVKEKASQRMSVPTQHTYTSCYPIGCTSIPDPHYRVARTCCKHGCRDRNDGAYGVRVAGKSVLKTAYSSINNYAFRKIWVSTHPVARSHISILPPTLPQIKELPKIDKHRVWLSCDRRTCTSPPSVLYTETVLLSRLMAMCL